MARFRRINIDGRSLFKTETRLLAAAAYPGMAVRIDPTDEEKFVIANGVTSNGPVYILDENWYEGKYCMDQIPADSTVIGNYAEEGREFAVRMAAGTYRKDQAVHINAAGLVTLVPATAGTYNVLGYVQEQEEVTTTAIDLIRIRVQRSTVTVS